MKRIVFFSLMLLIVLMFLYVPSTTAENESYTQLGLPEGAKARLGKGRINEIAYSPDGTRLAVATSIGVWIYDAQTGEELDLLTGHTGFVDFSMDGKILASGSWDYTIGLWDAETDEHLRTLEGHTDWVNSVAFSPDGTTIVSGSDDYTLRLWDVATGETLRTLEGHTDWVGSVSFSPDGNTIASGSWDKTIRLWDAKTGEHLRTLEGHTSGVRSVSFSPDGNTIVSGSEDKTLRLWDAKTGEHLRTLEGHTSGVRSVSFSPDGNTIVSGSEDKTLRLWDAKTGEHLRTLKGHTSWVHSVSFSPDGNTIVSGSEDGTILLWEVSPTGKRSTTWAKLKTMAVFQNYPNPSNPETWIPYQLAKPAEVTLTIYDMQGIVVHESKLGHQDAGTYQSRGRAAHWDGRNTVGESVASGIYFYTLTAGDFTATRRMLILK